MSEKPPSLRQRYLVELARRAWPGRSLEVIAPEPNEVHVWNERGRALLHVEHEHADAVLELLAGDITYDDFRKLPAKGQKP